MPAIRVTNFASVWLVASTSEPWHARIVVLLTDGSFVCSCKRGTRGCVHVDEARMDAGLDAFAEEENSRALQHEERTEMAGA